MVDGTLDSHDPVRRDMTEDIMSRTPFPVAAATLALLLATSPLTAQSIRGHVVLTGWGEPVPTARVELLDRTMTPISSTRTDAAGAYRFDRLEPGSYYVQAVHGERFSSIAGPIELAREEDATGADLTMRSDLFDRSLACLEGGQLVDHGVLAGVAYDGATEIPLPGARVVAEWSDDAGQSSQVTVDTDAAGRFVLCDLPARTGLTVWVASLGRTSDRERGVSIDPGAVARLDIPVPMGRAASVQVLEARANELRTEHAATVEGRLLDGETETPIPGAEIRLTSEDRRALTDAAGRFRFTRVTPGQTQFAVRRLGYEWESGAVEVPESSSMVLELRAAPQAIELDAVVVRASSAEAREARALTQETRVVWGDRLRLAEERTAPVSEVIRQFPSLRIREGQYETVDGVEYGICVEATRAMPRFAPPAEQQTRYPWCEGIAVVVDGMVATRGLEMLHALPIWEVESIEFLPPLGAIQWGDRAALNGALVIWTRGRGPHRDPSRNPPR
jgi:hypothetical protein